MARYAEHKNSVGKSRLMCAAMLFLCIAMGFGNLVAVEAIAPTKDRWQPVEEELGKQNDEAALPLLNTIVSDFPKWDHGWLKRAEVNERLDNLSLALTDAQQAYTLNADSEEIASTVGRLLVRQGDYQGAIDVLNGYLPEPTVPVGSIITPPKRPFALMI